MTDQTGLALEETGDEMAVPRDVELSDDLWPTILAEMVDVLLADNLRLGMPRADAIAQAQRVVLLLAEHQGGRSYYLPRGDRLTTALRDQQIYLSHRGDNVRDLADQHGLTVRHIQRIYAEQRAIHLRKRQARLFQD